MIQIHNTDVYLSHSLGTQPPAINVVKPLGWVALGLFLAGCVCIGMFKWWAIVRMNSLSVEEQENKLHAAAQRKVR
jgi:hypothetical protein